jgi:FdrA protein
VDHVEARPGTYADSVTLMQVSAQVREGDGVEAALVAMATDLNLELLTGLGFAAPPGVSQDDLLIAVRASDEAALAGALGTVTTALGTRSKVTAKATGFVQPRTVSSAVRAAGPGIALISVPGQHAFTEAMDALDAGCDVMIFSDNVPVEQEILLKDTAAARGLLVMGPDCGTAVVGGTALGFSHTLAPGPVGLVAASGTGAQQVLCLLDAAGTGVSAALGVGGRDLSAQVAGRSARIAMAALDEDPATRLIMVVSKPPAPEVAAQLRAYAQRLATPVHFAFLAEGEPDLTAATEHVLRAAGLPVPAWPSWPGPPATAAPGPTEPAPATHPAQRPGTAAAATPAMETATNTTAAPTGPRPTTPAADTRTTPEPTEPRPTTPAADTHSAPEPTEPRPTTPAADTHSARIRGAARPVPRASPAPASPAPAPPAQRAGMLRGLFAGGSLCDEAMIIASQRLGVIRSNIPLRPQWRLGPHDPAEGHVMIDFGDDELTAGRPHPMIDQSLRLERLAALARDPATAVLLLDVVLGHGAHPDPASELAPAIAAARAERDLPVVVSLIGAARDPQQPARQARELQAAGAHVFASNAHAARFACALLAGPA